MPVNLGTVVNTANNDLHPYVSSDGRTLVFDSDRPGGVGDPDLWVTARAAELTVTANEQSRPVGQANPPLTYDLSGFVGGEHASVVSGTASCTTTATPSSPAGDYPITCTVGSLGAPGYVFDLCRADRRRRGPAGRLRVKTGRYRRSTRIYPARMCTNVASY